MNVKKMFKQLYLEKYADQIEKQPDLINIDWENVIFYTEQSSPTAVRMVVYFKHNTKENWQRANILIDTQDFKIDDIEFTNDSLAIPTTI